MLTDPDIFIDVYSEENANRTVSGEFFIAGITETVGEADPDIE